MATLGIEVIARNQAAGVLHGLEGQLRGLDRTAADVNGRLRDSNGRFLAMGNSSRQLGGGFGIVQRGLSGIVSTAVHAGSSVGHSLGRIAEYAVGGIVAHGIMQIGRSFIGAGRDALSGIGDMKSSLNLLQAQSGASDAQMEQVRRTAIKLGADMTLPTTSANDATVAMLELGKAGLTLNDAMAAAPGTLRLAAAGSLAEAEAATITANALNMWSLKGSEATRVADLLAAAANQSSAEVHDVALSYQMSGAVLASVGVPIEDATTAITLLANKGLAGSDAGTSLKQTFLSLMSPTKEAAKLMDRLGINVYDAAGNMLAMPQIFDQFNNGLKGLTQEQRNAALSTIFGSDAIRAANILLNEGSENFYTMRTAITKTGSAEEMAAARTRGLKGALQGLGSQVETAGAQFAAPLVTPLTKGLQELAGFVGSPQVMAALEKAGKWLGEKLGGAVEKLGPWLDNAAQKLPGFITGVSGIVDIFQGKDPLGNWKNFRDTMASTFGEDMGNKIAGFARKLSDGREAIAGLIKFATSEGTLGNFRELKNTMIDVFGEETGKKVSGVAGGIQGILDIFKGDAPMGGFALFRTAMNESFGEEAGGKIADYAKKLSDVRNWVATNLPAGIEAGKNQLIMLRDDLLGGSGDAARIANQYAADFKATIEKIKASPDWGGVTEFFSNLGSILGDLNQKLLDFIERVNGAARAQSLLGSDTFGGVDPSTLNLPGTQGYRPPTDTHTGAGGRRNASGALWSPGGLTLVGEAGPELVQLPRGSRVYSNGETRAMMPVLAAAGGGGRSISITVIQHIGSIGSAVDAEAMAQRTAAVIARRQRDRR